MSFKYYKPITIERIFNQEGTTVEFKKKGHIALMCPICFNYTVHRINTSFKITNYYDYDHRFGDLVNSNNVYSGYCTNPDCNHYTKFIELDINLAEIVSILNKKGYRTAYCCEGHINGEGISFTYIVFEDVYFKDNDYNLPDSYTVAIQTIKETAKGKVEVSRIKDNCLAENLFGLTRNEMLEWLDKNYNHKKQIKDLYNWVIKLPENKNIRKRRK
jgi:hypothetical protein